MAENLTLKEYFATAPAPEFRSEAKYFREGDFVSAFTKDCEYYAQRIDEVLTIYREEGTDELVGCKIKSISHLLRRIGDFSVHIEDFATNGRKVRMAVFFLTAGFLADVPRRKHYAEVAKKLKDACFDLDQIAQASAA